MSTGFPSHPSSLAADRFSDAPPATDIARTLTDILIRASGIGPKDRVLVFGPDMSRHVTGLAAAGCGSATGVRSDERVLRHERAEVVWFTGINDAAGMAAIGRCDAESARLIAIDLPAAGDGRTLPGILRTLAARGFVQCATQTVEDRLVITVSRPNWLRRVI
ncbi:MAG: hypothetical protein F8N37_17245 [Telmatospirillum sp.]|nr:hypothetical protein [Telmatospirillum sp.]